MADAPRAPRYYEDVVVGERTRTGSFTFTRESIVAFATQYDPQPMHLSEEGGKASFFKRQIASGWQTVGVTMRMMVEAHPFGSTPLIGLQIDETSAVTDVDGEVHLLSIGEILIQQLDDF